MDRSLMQKCSIPDCARPVKYKAAALCNNHYEMKRRNGAPKPMPHKAPSFIERAILMETDECIPWPYAKTPGGYAQVWVGKTMIHVSRIVLERTVGPAPSPNHVAAHMPVLCHNRLCVNKRHLRWATRSENCEDMIADGTALIGEANGNAKLTYEQADLIRMDSRMQKIIATEYGVSQSLVAMIKGGKRWKTA